MATFFSTEDYTASSSISAGDFLTIQNTTWITAATDTIDFTVQWFYDGIDYVREKIKEIFDNRAKIKQYRKSLFTEKIRQTSRIIKKQAYTIMIPSKRNFRGQEAQRK